MKRHLWRIFSIAICIGIMISCTACQSVIGSSKNITELNQAYNGSKLKITATDIKAINDPIENDKIVVGVRFIIENISNKDLFTHGGNIGVYIDDAAVSKNGSSKKYFDEEGEELIIYGTIASDKKTNGYYCVKAPKNSKSIEIHFNYSSDSAIFIFDIPSVENVE